MAFDSSLIEAKIELKQIGYSEFPALAVEALEAGLDGPGVRRMAALVQPTGFEIDEALPNFLRDAGLRAISPTVACIRLALALANELVISGRDPLPELGKFERLYMLAGYPSGFRELGFIEEDTWTMRHLGESEKEIRKRVDERLKDFIEDNRE